jgi:transcriptional regulator with XRE-family HTH domain
LSKETGERVRALRTARGIAQADLAATLGVSKSYLSHIEAGRRPIPGPMLQRVASALEVEVEQLESGIPAGLYEDVELKLAFAELSLRNGDRATAAEEFAAILERAKDLPLQRFLDEATWGLARADEANGQLESAIVRYEELLGRHALSGAVSKAVLSMRLLMAYSECGDLGRAVDIGERAIEEATQSDPAEEVTTIVELISSVAGCYLERGDLMRAQMLIDRAIALAAEDGTPRSRAAAAWNAAIIAERRHDAVGARRHADRALALYSEIDGTRSVAMLRVVSAMLRLHQDEPDHVGALAEVEVALEELREVGSRLDLAYARSQQARALLRGGDPVGAGEVARRALQDLSTGDRLLTGHMMIVLGHVSMMLGDDEEALAYFEQAATAIEDVEGPGQAGTAWREVGEAYLELGRQQEGIAALRRASDLAGATYNPLRPSLAAATGRVAR